MERIPTPWKKSKNVLGEFSIHWGEKADRGTTIATARTEAAADKILQAVNSHEALVKELRHMIRSYVDLLESGRETIVELGGECDSVENMKKDSPCLTSARAALRKAGAL